MITFCELTDEPSDLAALRAFYDTLYVAEFPDPDERESLANMVGYLRRKAQGWYGRNSYHIVLGRSGDEIVAASVSDYLAEPNAGVIEFLLISPSSRGSGVGRQLLAYTEGLFEQDAQRAVGRSLDCVLAEMNDPLATSALTDNLNPVTRALIWQRWGYHGLDFPYVQPALSPDQDPVTNLILICKPLREDWSAAVPSHVVGTAVHEYLRWAMRIDQPEQSPEFQDMAKALSRVERVNCLPLDRYVGRGLDVEPVAGQPAGRHVWTVADDVTSFFTLSRAGFVDRWAPAATLPSLVARIETQLLAERTAVRGWYTEVAPGADIERFRHAGCHELAVDHRLPDSAEPMRLLFKPTGRVYDPPRLAADDFRADLIEILGVVHHVADPDVAAFTGAVPLR